MITVKDLPDWLQKNHQDKLMFGLGFIQVKVDEHTRYHFYHPELESIMDEEEVHDHRYGFKSEVLKGCLQQELFNVVTRGSHKQVGIDWKYVQWTIQEVSCDPNNPVSGSYKDWCTFDSSAVITTKTGSEYEISKNTFHKVLPTKEPTVTLITRELPSKVHARVLRKNGAEEVCPFSPSMTDDELWNWVNRICDH